MRARERAAAQRQAERAHLLRARADGTCDWSLRYGAYSVLEASPDGVTVQCHICGKWVRGLGVHGWMEHAIRADEYREQFGLMAKTGLVSPDTRQRYANASEQNRAGVDKAEVRRKLQEARARRYAQPIPYRPRREEAKRVMAACTRTDEAWKAMSRKGVEARAVQWRVWRMNKAQATCAWCHDAILTTKQANQNHFCSVACYRRAITGIDTERLQKGRATLAARRAATDVTTVGA